MSNELNRAANYLGYLARTDKELLMAFLEQLKPAGLGQEVITQLMTVKGGTIGSDGTLTDNEFYTKLYDTPGKPSPLGQFFEKPEAQAQIQNLMETLAAQKKLDEQRTAFAAKNPNATIQQTIDFYKGLDHGPDMVFRAMAQSCIQTYQAAPGYNPNANGPSQPISATDTFGIIATSYATIAMNNAVKAGFQAAQNKPAVPVNTPAYVGPDLAGFKIEEADKLTAARFLMTGKMDGTEIDRDNAGFLQDPQKYNEANFNKLLKARWDALAASSDPNSSKISAILQHQFMATRGADGKVTFHANSLVTGFDKDLDKSSAIGGDMGLAFRFAATGGMTSTEVAALARTLPKLPDPPTNVNINLNPQAKWEAGKLEAAISEVKTGSTATLLTWNAQNQIATETYRRMADGKFEQLGSGGVSIRQLSQDGLAAYALRRQTASVLASFNPSAPPAIRKDSGNTLQLDGVRNFKSSMFKVNEQPTVSLLKGNPKWNPSGRIQFFGMNGAESKPLNLGIPTQSGRMTADAAASDPSQRAPSTLDNTIEQINKIGLGYEGAIASRPLTGATL